MFTPDSGEQNWVQFKKTFKAPPSPAGFVLASVTSIDFHGANVTWDSNVKADPQAETFELRLTSANFNKQRQLPFDVTLVYQPTDAARAAVDAANNTAKDEYKDAVAAENETKFFETLRTRLKLVSQVRTRSQTDLRDEERNMIYRSIISRLYGKESGWDNEDYHVASEIVRYFFDIDSMLYFVAPDWWKPRTSKGKSHEFTFSSPLLTPAQSRQSQQNLNPPSWPAKRSATASSCRAPVCEQSPPASDQNT